MRRRILPSLLVSALALLVGCQTGPQPDSPSAESRTPESPSSDAQSSPPAAAGDKKKRAPSSDQPLGWRPTAADLEQAQQLVSGWGPAELAGQVIVGRYYGTDPQDA